MPPFQGPARRWTNDEVNSWLCNRPEDPFFPSVPIVDPHHHLFLAPSQPVPIEVPPRVFATFGRAPFTSRYIREDISKDFIGVNVVATVHVEAKTSYDRSLKYPSVGETLFLKKVSNEKPSSGLCRGIVAAVDLTQSPETVQEHIQAHRDVLKDSTCRLSGIRMQLANHPKLLSAAKEAIVEQCKTGAEVAGKMGLPVDIWLYSHQLAELFSLAKACPSTIFVCDHIGGPIGCNSSVFDAWLTDMGALASLPNVVVKLGGLGMHVCGYSEESPLHSDELVERFLPWFREMFVLFGQDRLMFESNFPMDKASFSYVSYWNAAKKLSMALSNDPYVRRKLLFENANHLLSQILSTSFMHSTLPDNTAIVNGVHPSRSSVANGTSFASSSSPSTIPRRHCA